MAMKTKVIHAKITRPVHSGAVERARLFTLLDEAVNKPVIWISAPGGAGKTTLVANYLDARQLPCLWYQCDGGDTDLATFFYYMGLAAKNAAPRRRKSLPLLTPEYLAGIPTFSRRFFESLYNILLGCSSASAPPHSYAIVLDNYQDVPSGSPFHEILAAGFDSVPEGIRIVVVSRSGPSAEFSRLQANKKIGRLTYDDIRFTFDESRELISCQVPAMSDDDVRTIHRMAEGWAAGIILMLEKGKLDGKRTSFESVVARDKVFDYFAGEIFCNLSAKLQNFLLRSALLPLQNVQWVEELVKDETAGQILNMFHRHHLFTERLAGGGEDYLYHPLFREFLLNRAKSSFTPDELAGQMRAAARILELAGKLEDAARLYCEIGEREALARMVVNHSQELLRQGRNKTIDSWVECIPDIMMYDDPWLCYWIAMPSFPFDMPRTRQYLEMALSSFMRQEIVSGIYLAWAGIVDTYAFGGDWSRLDGCIELFGDLNRSFPVIPSQEIDLTVSSRMLVALTLRKTDQPQKVQKWQQKVAALLMENPSFDIKMDTFFSLSVYYLWKGEYDKNAILLDRAAAEMSHHTPTPFSVIRIRLMKGIQSWITAEYEAALGNLAEGLAVSAESGVHVYDSLLWSFRAAAEMAGGQLECAEISLKNQLDSLLGVERSLDVYFFHINSAWFSLLSGKPARAAEHMELIRTNDCLGTPYYRALWLIGMSQVAYLQGLSSDAKSYLKTAYGIALSMKSQVMEWYSLLMDAHFKFMDGNDTGGLLSLYRGITLGSSRGYVHLEFYQPAVMRTLYSRALEEGIEKEYVTKLIRKLGLTPPMAADSYASSARYLEVWPYPVKIFTLGRFEIFRDDEPLNFSGKEQKKPLNLLKALISMGGRDVSEECLCDMLWPNAEGDLARKSFETTLSRLRRLLGGEEFITCRSRQITINSLCCWVDSIALECLYGSVSGAPAGEAATFCDKAAELYKGPFLQSDTGVGWIVRRREILRNLLLRAILTAVRGVEQENDWEKASEYYLKGIEIDPLAEEFYRRYMICCRNLGDNVSAVRAYDRCRSLLRAELGIEPAPETSAVLSSLIPPR